MEVVDEHPSNPVLDKPSPGLPPTQLAYIDAPSDVIPDVYEGGLKTWECSVDVVEYLSQLNVPFQGKAILEVGCGTAIPTAYLLQTLLNSTETPPKDKSTIIHVQDYNKSVLELVTLPNLILAWCKHPLGFHSRTHPHPTRFINSSAPIPQHPRPPNARPGSTRRPRRAPNHSTSNISLSPIPTRPQHPTPLLGWLLVDIQPAWTRRSSIRRDHHLGDNIPFGQRLFSTVRLAIRQWEQLHTVKSGTLRRLDG